MKQRDSRPYPKPSPLLSFRAKSRNLPCTEARRIGHLRQERERGNTSQGRKLRVSPSPYRHFERSEKSSLHTGETESVRQASERLSDQPHACRTPLRQERSLGCARDDETRDGPPHSLSSRCESQPPSLRGTSFQRKEGEAQKPSPYRHFERSEKSSLHTGETESVRQAPEWFSEQPHACRTQLGQERSLGYARDDETRDGLPPFPFIPSRRRLPLRGSLSSAFGAPLFQGATPLACKSAMPEGAILVPSP